MSVNKNNSKKNVLKLLFTRDEFILSSSRDAELFFDAIFNPEAPNDKLKAAVEKLNLSYRRFDAN
jgi:uncharacterized protein (DUF1778 family)